jgi:hypothetical protein
MGWARLDDSFHDHPKVDGITLAAVGLYTLCLTWAHRHRKTAIIPGHITVARARKVAGRQSEALSDELVVARLWDVEPNIGGWVIHDFADYLPKDRDPSERAEAGRKGAAKRWQGDGNLPSASHEVAGSVPPRSMASDSSRASAPAFPTRPVPDQTDQPPSSATPTDFDAFWDVWPRKVAKQAAAKAYAKAVKHTAPDVIRDSARRQLAAWAKQGRTPEFVPHAASWLNGERWDDEVTAPTSLFGVGYSDADREGPSVVMTGAEWATQHPRSAS